MSKNQIKEQFKSSAGSFWGAADLGFLGSWNRKPVRVKILQWPRVALPSFFLQLAEDLFYIWSRGGACKMIPCLINQEKSGFSVLELHTVHKCLAPKPHPALNVMQKPLLSASLLSGGGKWNTGTLRQIRLREGSQNDHVPRRDLQGVSFTRLEGRRPLCAPAVDVILKKTHTQSLYVVVRLNSNGCNVLFCFVFVFFSIQQSEAASVLVIE